MGMSMTFDTALPIDDVLPTLDAALAHQSNAVLVAPPGAGKTTRVPLVLLDAPWRRDGRIIVLEPRRLAARGAATRMAQTLGVNLGDLVGLRVRLGSRISARTRIEVVTEGVFTRMILDDPALEGIAAVLFDEFHERSLDADLGLALALEAQAALRPDLRILVMSATLDGARVAKLLGDAPVIESQGRSFPVETRHLPRDPRGRLEDQVADAVMLALREETGSILVFLPGQAEIRRVHDRLAERIDPAVTLADLHGGLDPRDQDLAVRPAEPGRRKVVLATSIAETSLTIEGVRVVVDAGLSRVPVYEPSAGLTRLATVKVSRAAADQRRGRAGRTEPGVCYRLWEEAATGSLEPFAKPEILSSDLSGLALDLAGWGAADPAQLSWLDPPPASAMAEAKGLLRALGALDQNDRLTEGGQTIRALPLPPRLAAMIVAVPGQRSLAAELAVLVVERGLGGSEIDIALRLTNFRRDRSRRAEDARQLARRWAPTENEAPTTSSPGVLLARAYPDRIAQARGKSGSFRLANGRGANLDPVEALAREPYVVAAELTGSAASARIQLAAAISREDIEEMFADRITAGEEISFDRNSASLRARFVRRLDALVLDEQPRSVPLGDEAAKTLAEGIISLGIERLPWNKSLGQWRERVMFLRRAEGDEWPDLSDQNLAETAFGWLAPFLIGKTALAQISEGDLDTALKALLPYNLSRRLEAEAPTHFPAPSGSRVPIDYGGDEPVLSIRVQELFGLGEHPAIAAGRVPLVLELLSPAHRPVQVTRDLPGFWRGSWNSVRAEMRGRYPKHPWPEDPLNAPATNRTKRRMEM
ncbi:ATP-dependent helicase [Agaricicola taiwanensis]|uniref:ATP-dependent helicase n=2 Tax=Agaricicola taiwanensis TaxID=591372 RepID=A0A8J2VN78_9RHOB|nr:ATP-dependent helicase [Agaricicola taiwanensis]